MTDLSVVEIDSPTPKKHPFFFYADKEDLDNKAFRSISLSKIRKSEDNVYTYATWEKNGQIRITRAVRSF